MDTDDAQAQPKAPSVGKAWAWLIIFSGVMTLIGFLVWGSLFAAPDWFHTLFGFQVLWAIVGVVSAHKRRSEWEANQRPV